MVGLPSLSVDSNSSEPVHLYHWFPDRVGVLYWAIYEKSLGHFALLDFEIRVDGRYLTCCQVKIKSFIVPIHLVMSTPRD